MTYGKPAVQMLRFAAPITLGLLIQQTYGWINTYIIGQYLGVSALGALGNIDTLHYFINGFIAGLNVGITVCLSRIHGENDPPKFLRCFVASLHIAVGCGLLLLVLFQLILHPLFGLMQASGDVLVEAVSYCRVYFLCLPLLSACGVATSALYSMGDSRSPLLVTLLTSVIQIGTDWLFLVHWRLGIQSAALSSVLIALVQLGVYGYMLKRRFPHLLCLRGVSADRAMYRSILRMGLPMALQSSFTAMGVMVLQTAINALGTSVTAAFAAVSRIENVATIPHNTLGTAIATFTAQNYGSKRPDRVRQGLYAGLTMVLAASLITSGLILWLGKPVLQLFIAPEAVDALAFALYDLRYIAGLLGVLGCISVFRNVIQGLGNGMYPMLIGMVECVLRSGLALAVMRYGNFETLCLVNPILWIVVLLALGGYCFHTLHRLTKEYRHGIQEPEALH